MGFIIKVFYKYLWHTLTAGKLHSIQSPFLYNFAKNCIYKKHEKKIFFDIESIRKKLEKNSQKILVHDFGEGPGFKKRREFSKPLIYERKIKKIANTSLKRRKECLLLSELVSYLKPDKIIELGTSFGITTLYIAKARQQALVTTIEGCPNISSIAAENFSSLSMENIDLINCTFDDGLKQYLKSVELVDMAIIDGNHGFEPVKEYFELLSQQISEKGVIIIDDINWSNDMMKVWEYIKHQKLVTLTIDLFNFGIIFFDKDLSKENVRLKF